MTDDEAKSRFTPTPRGHRVEESVHDVENIRAELKRIIGRARYVASTDRSEFVDGSTSYDVASMVIIRLASLTERPEFSHLAIRLTSDEVTAIRATRNIAAHAGYVAMNDELFWAAVTVRVPEIVNRLLEQ